MQYLAPKHRKAISKPAIAYFTQSVLLARIVSKVSLGFSEEGKASIAHEVACNGRDLKFEQMSCIFLHARHPFESVYH